MPSQTVGFSKEEDKMVDYFKTAFDMHTKPDAIREMIKIAYKTRKKKIMAKVKTLDLSV